MPKKDIKKVIVKTGKSFWNLFPLLLGTILLVSLFIKLIPKSFYFSIFEGHFLIGSFMGSLIGSISAGTPLTSYIIGGELLEQGTSLIVVTAFLVAWVTVGIIQLPAESTTLGKKFALLRNLLAFIFSIIIAIITILILEVIKCF